MIELMLDSLNSPYIHAANSDNFNALVLENSARGPVLVNFWSRKAGPCLRQYPILDKLVHEYKGRFLLINVDTEKEFIYTKEYGVASVPTLKLFRYGEVAATLHGYQSETDLIKLLDQYVARESDRILAQAVQLYSQGQQDKAYQLITDAIFNDPVNPRLPLAMCKMLRHEQRNADALKLLKSLPDALSKQAEIRAMYEIISFQLERADEQDSEQLQIQIDNEPEELELKRQLFIQLLIEQQYQPALQQLVEIMQQDQSFDDNYAQRAMLRVFTVLGEKHPLISAYRSNLTRYTY